MDKAPGIADARSKVDNIHWHVPQFELSIRQQCILAEPMSSKTATKLRYIEDYVFLEDLKHQYLSNFELVSPEKLKVKIWNFVKFQQRDRQDSQNLNSYTFCRLPVTSAACIIGMEKHLDAAIILYYDDDDSSQ